MLTSIAIFVILCLFWHSVAMTAIRSVQPNSQDIVVKRHALKQDVFSLFNGLFCISVRKREINLLQYECTIGE